MGLQRVRHNLGTEQILCNRYLTMIILFNGLYDPHFIAEESENQRMKFLMLIIIIKIELIIVLELVRPHSFSWPHIFVRIIHNPIQAAMCKSYA